MNATVNQPQPPGATVGDWVAGARPRTLPAAISPVLAGSGIAWFADAFTPARALLALLVSLALQIGVNYANDYSDGIRGTDADRVGPMRLVGSGLVDPPKVKRAAFGCFAVAGIAGVALVAISGTWWLLIVGALSILAAWFYTGGRNPYGYLGLGEVFVFVFFGLVAVCGTAYVMMLRASPAALAAACAIGFLACALLVANNLRDIDGDRLSGKKTLATRLGHSGTKTLYVTLVAGAAVAVAVVAALTSWWALLGLVFAIPAAITCRAVLGVGHSLGRNDHLALIGVLKKIGIAELLCAVGLAAGLVLGTVL